MQFESGTRILRVIHLRDARATSANWITALNERRVDNRELALLA
jgi:hypothetical protein